MMKPTIYVSRKIPNEFFEPYQNDWNVEMWHEETQVVDRDVFLKHVQKADALFTTLTERVDREALDQAKNLKVIANLAVGYDNIDVEYAKEKGIVVTNTPDVLSETTADLTFALLMATARRIVEAEQFIKDGKWTNWAPFLLAGADIHHKTIGIVGMGRIGEAIARRARGFDMKILYHNRSRKEKVEQEIGALYSSFDELITTSDFVVCMTPLTEDTENMFQAEEFKKMKSSAIFINTSRGGVVNEEDLYNALKKKDIQAAGLDVFQNEPIDEHHPLLQLENVTALPHIGSATYETRSKMITLCLHNINQVLKGNKPITPIL
ncbi:glyoxylate reductase [Salinibacillus kushneri]|uniref:Glyoxylate reductase n=1 Tax=Salinibacillus kushneri TaxID=237682 RepID=A0A1H9Y872_9BACI|nr:D-glycerate dehydrogenase [Salinibacillus kushneri]SES65110.1 glyoxylate reductase [Salinibacillus kushneri]